MWDQKWVKTIRQIILSVHVASKTLLVLVFSKTKLLCRQCRGFTDCVPDHTLRGVLLEGRNRIDSLLELLLQEGKNSCQRW